MSAGLISVRIHTINFFKPEVKAINCISYDEYSSRLAVARSDFSIEIYDLKGKPFLERVILGCPTNSVETVVFCNGRLFSAGLNGQITEYNLLTLLPEYGVPVGAEQYVWCLALNKQKTYLAAGTEDGRVCIFGITPTSLCFEKNLDLQEGRVLCIAWHDSGDFIVTGSIDNIRIWDVKTGTAIDRIIVGREERKKETIVWCIAITSDMTIISGDSRGKTCFWDGKTGTLLTASSVHKADVLALCLEENETVVYSSGVDPVIVKHVLTDLSGDGKIQEWISSTKNTLHSHDVRALQLAGKFLVSGGVDARVVLMKYQKTTFVKLCPFSEAGYCSVASDVCCVALRYPKEIQVWKLGKSDVLTGSFDGDLLPLTSKPMKILTFATSVMETIACCAISRNGEWLAYSTANKLHLFHLNIEKEQPITEKIKKLPVENPASALAFTPCGSRLILCNSAGALQVINCDIHNISLLAELESKDAIERRHLLAVCEKFVATADHNSNIHIYKLKTLSMFCSLPKYKVQPTAMEFDREGEKLVVVYSDRMFLEYTIKEKISTLCRKLKKDQRYPIIGITFCEERILFYDSNCIYRVDRRNEDKLRYTKKSKQARESEDLYFRVKVTHGKFNYLLSFKDMEKDFVAVSISPQCIIKQLPGALFKKRFGM